MGSDARTLYLLLTITFLEFFTSLYLPISGDYRMALFTTISLPVVYSARYFSASAAGEENLHFFKVVSKKETVIKDMIAVTSAFCIGYIVYVATTMNFYMSGLYYFTVAFVIILFLRYVIAVWYKTGIVIVNVDDPIVITAASVAFAVLGFALEWIIFEIF